MVKNSITKLAVADIWYTRNQDLRSCIHNSRCLFRSSYILRVVFMLLYSDLGGRWDVFFLPEVVAQIWLDPLRDFWGCWTTFIQNFFRKIHSFMLLGQFLTSNSLHNLGGQKNICLCYHARHFQPIHWKKNSVRCMASQPLRSNPNGS